MPAGVCIVAGGSPGGGWVNPGGGICVLHMGGAITAGGNGGALICGGIFVIGIPWGGILDGGRGPLFTGIVCGGIPKWRTHHTLKVYIVGQIN